MSEFSFTSGPLTVVRSSNPNNPDIRLMAGTEVVMTIHHLGRGREKEFLANAMLMSTASKLYEALKLAHDMELDRDDEARNFDNSRLAYWGTLLKVIARPPLRPLNRRTA